MKRDTLFLLVLLAVFGLFLLYLFTTVRNERQSQLSAYSTYRSDKQGCRALFLLAQQLGFRPQRLRHSLRLIEEGRLLFLIQPGGAPGPLKSFQSAARVSAPSIKALQRWVEAGNTLVIATHRMSLLLEAFGYGLRVKKLSMKAAKGERPLSLAWSGTHILSPVPKGFRPLYSTEAGHPLIGVSSRGQGWVMVVASPFLFANEGIAQKQNVHFVANILSLYAHGEPVLFDEYHHGYQYERTFLGYLQYRGLHLAFYQLLMALVLLFWWGGVRFGPVRRTGPLDLEEENEDRPGDYVEALANLYAKARVTAHMGKLLAWDLQRALRQSLGGRVLRNTMTLVAMLRKRKHPQAERIPALLLELESVATEATAQTETKLLSLAREVDLIKQQLQEIRFVVGNGFKPFPTGPHQSHNHHHVPNNKKEQTSV